MSDIEALLPVVRGAHEAMRDHIIEQCERQSVEALSAVAHDKAGDTLYVIDRAIEDQLIEHFDRAAREANTSLVLIAEGQTDEPIVLPRCTSLKDAAWRVIVDPIDGTRPLMYQKRSAWLLTGIAPNHGDATRLRDIELAVQTELPILKQHLCDQLWAQRGGGAYGERVNRFTGQREPLPIHPSSATTIAHGWAMVTRIVPGARDVLAAIDEEVVHAALGAPADGKASCFEDQYTSTGGQLYELMMGRDRFNADLRPLVAPYLEARGLPAGLCCHPYDLSTWLIAHEAGVLLTDAAGDALDAPLDLTSDVAWVAYANEAIRQQVEPALQHALRCRGMLRD
jgi:fructose-1,6-bisphosphatase/inositol monophosphatase family enzyme